MENLRTILLSMVLEPIDDGYLARCPNIQGAFAEGDTIEEAMFNCVDVVKLIFQYRTERGEPLSVSEIEMTSQQQLAVSIPVGVH